MHHDASGHTSALRAPVAHSPGWLPPLLLVAWVLWVLRLRLKRDAPEPMPFSCTCGTTDGARLMIETRWIGQSGLNGVTYNNSTDELSIASGKIAPHCTNCRLHHTEKRLKHAPAASAPPAGCRGPCGPRGRRAARAGGRRGAAPAARRAGWGPGHPGRRGRPAPPGGAPGLRTVQ